MGRLRKSKVDKSPFKLRRRRLADGRESLYIYWHTEDNHQKVENLGLFLLPETSVKAKRENAKTLRKAQEIIDERTETMITARADSFGKDLNSGMLLTEWIHDVKSRHQRRGARDLHGLYNCGVSVGRFRPDTLLKDVDKQFLLDYLDWLRNEYRTKDYRRLSDRSIHSYTTTLRTILNEAARDGLIASNPWRMLDITEKAKCPVSKREFLTVDEVKLLMATPHFNDDVKRAYLFSCFCGLRISDIRKLRWRDINRIGEPWTISVIMTKTDNPVIVPLSSQSRKRLPESTAADDLVFKNLPNAGNLCLNLKSWAKKAGVKKNVTFHTARHTFATMLLTLGVDIYTVSKLLGHSSVRQTQVYAKIIDSKKDDAISLIDNAYNS